MADDLSAPLGHATRHRRWKIPIAVPATIAGGLVFCLVIFVVWAAVVTDPLGGEPVVVVATERHYSPQIKAGAPPEEGPVGRANSPETEPKADVPVRIEASQAAATLASPTTNAPGGQTVTIIDGSSGKKQEVIIPAASAPQVAAIDQKLLETTRHGQIPRIGLDGVRAATSYAVPVAATGAKAGFPRVALVICGLGVSASSTAEALGKLPGPVTLAFTPYASDLNRLTARARGEGHEVLLQLPMEPFDYPDNDPGPQTLLTSLAPEQNIDRMHWLMSRFQGYVGVASYMGARFTATEAALAPILRETAKRGLLYFDDGTSPRSLAGQIAGANNLPFAKANVVLDAVPTQAEFDRALLRLESVARESGFAIGVASALPIAIARLSQWAKSADARGFLLVPISAIAMKPKSS